MGSMYGIYTNIGGILMVNVTLYIAYMDPMGMFNGQSMNKWHFWLVNRPAFVG